MLKAWHSTHDLNLAATLATCGVTVVPVSVLAEVTGQRKTTYHFGGGGDLPAAVLPADDPQRVRERFSLVRQSAPLKVSPGLLRDHLVAGTLAEADPTHPALDVLAVLHARECLLTYANRGTRYRIEVIPGVPRARLIPGPESMIAQPGQTWLTDDLGMASALTRVGVPVLGIQGGAPHRGFVLPKFGHHLPGRHAPEDVLALVDAWRSKELARQCPEHPVVWGMAGLRWRLALQRHVEQGGSGRQVLLYHARSSEWQRKNRSAMVEEAAPDTALDDALRHMRG